MAFNEDLSVFLSTAEFAVDAIVDGVPVQALFDKAFALGSGGASGFATTQPMLTLATSDVPANYFGKVVVVNGSTYTIEIHEPDGTGVSALMLQKA
jgi:hypothetical protein